MSWNDVIGHENVLERFRRSAQQGRLAGTYLFVGPAGTGKHTFALKLAEALLCESQGGELLTPCGMCEGCQLVRAGTHPDLSVVTRRDDRAVIQIDQLIGDREHRNQEGFCHDMSLRPMRGARRVGIIDDADLLNEESANCLLKTLEEPPPGAVLILIATSLQKQLPTIRSRSQVVAFQLLTKEQVAEVLTRRGLVEDPAMIDTLAALSGGSVQRALLLADPALLEYRQQLLTSLTKADWSPIGVAKEVNDFVQAAGSEAPPRRQRLRQLTAMLADYYQAHLRAALGLTVEGDPFLVDLIGRAQASNAALNVEQASQCVERCIETEAHVAANANQSTTIEALFDDLWARTFENTPVQSAAQPSR